VDFIFCFSHSLYMFLMDLKVPMLDKIKKTKHACEKIS